MRSNKQSARRILFTLGILVILGVVVVGAQTFDSTQWRPLRWRSIGPQRGGRVLAVSGVPGNPDVYYFGAVAGGVWKTTNSGENWTPMTDTTDIRSVGAIAVAPSDPNVIYVGTGESCIRGDVSYGDGMWKSTDAGKTWMHIGLEDTHHIARIAVDPHNADVVLVAALGHAFGPNAERGVFRSTDGGKTWTKSLFKDDKTGAIDISMDPNNPRIVFAALYQFVRMPWGFESGGPGSGLYRSTDGGATWTQLRGRGLPAGLIGRIGLSVSAADGNRVYAIIEAERGGVYRSDNGGDSWQFLTGDHNLTQRSWYFHHIFADTKNPDVVYVLNTSILRSVDGGRTFTGMRAPHGDNHGLWIDPTNADWIINSNDGGATVTHNGGRTWTTQDNQPTAEFYHVDTDSRFPYLVYGSQQDNSTVAISSRGGGGRGGGNDFYAVGGGESGWIVPKRDNPEITYGGSYDGLLTEYNHATDAYRDINPWPLNPMGSGAAEIEHRFQWTFPIASSPHDPNILYTGSQYLLMTNNGGSSWKKISGDLTRNDKSKQGPAGGSLSHDNTSVEYYDTVFCIAESPITKGEIWVGTDDGLVKLTRDGGATWTDVTPKGIPEWIKVSIVDPSANANGTAYIALDGQKLDDVHPYIYKTSDFGKTWTKITNGIPDGSFVHSVKADPKKKGLLFAGTESGVFISLDDGANWKSLRVNMPNTPVHDLVIKDNDLVVATHGRAFYIMDNITPLREMSSDAMNADAHLFAPVTAIRNRGGMSVDYWLKAAPEQPLKIEISDKSGKVIRTFTSAAGRGRGAAAPGEDDAAAQGGGRGGRGGFGGGGATPSGNAGLNRFTWDMRTEPPSEVPGAVYWAGRGGGAVVSTGDYSVKLSVNGQTYTSKVQVTTDPRIHVSQADLDKQYEFAMQINERVTAGHDAINQIRGLRQQIDMLHQRLAATPENKAVLDAADALNKKMTEVEEELIQTKSTAGEDALNFPIRVVNQLVALFGVVEGPDAAPTAQSYDVFEVLNKKLTASLAKWDDIQKKDLADFNAKMSQANIPGISVPPAKPAAPAGRGGRGGN
jgi:photosystem II stability/assembly factor-like uncharacterized protein